MKPVAVILLLTFLCAWGCGASLRVSRSVSDTPVSSRPELDAEYRIKVGDELDVKFFYNPELNEKVIVRPDGRISLQLVHEVMAADLTPAELRKFLIERYSPEIKKPELAVIVRSFTGQRIFVDGEVARPGMLPLVGFTTVFQALSQAGGLKETARYSEIVVIRRGANNKPYTFTVNLKEVIDGANLRQDVVLKPFDIIFVPRSAISNVNLWVDQYIRKNVPISTGFFYDLNP
jgi:protein involved in polysaccharide export with SLBB domain